MNSHGLCDTTSTERFEAEDCKCDTYPTNLGPCNNHEEGGRKGYCVYCDHQLNCFLRNKKRKWQIS